MNITLSNISLTSEKIKCDIYFPDMKLKIRHFFLQKSGNKWFPYNSSSIGWEFEEEITDEQWIPNKICDLVLEKVKKFIPPELIETLISEIK